MSRRCNIYRNYYGRYERNEPHFLSGEYRVLTSTPYLDSDWTRI